MDCFCYNRSGAICTHTSSIGTLIAVKNAFMILTCWKAHIPGTIHNYQHASFLTGKKLLKQDLTIRRYRLLNELFCFIKTFGDYYTLATSQNITLYHPWICRVFVECKIDVRVLIENLKVSSWNTNLLHYLLCV